MHDALRAAAAVVGLVIAGAAILSAIHTLVVPRSLRPAISRFVFVSVRQLFNMRVRRLRTYEERDRVMAHYGPTSLLVLLVVWLWMVTIGFTGIIWATSGRDLRESFFSSGSSLLTLGFFTSGDFTTVNVEFAEATIGIVLIAMLMAYLPSIYGAFSRREALVTKLSVRAGTPPSAIELIQRTQRIGWLDDMRVLWEDWETWFAQIGEAQTSLAALNFFRSPRHDRSWLTAAGAVLDGAALTLSSVDVRWDPSAALCIRSGYLSLRDIANFFDIPYDSDPPPDGPISISRSEFDEALARLVDAGVPVKEDHDQAWRDFNGWRVNYDEVLLGLCALVMPPYAPWSSDRSPRYRAPTVVHRRRTQPPHPDPERPAPD